MFEVVHVFESFFETPTIRFGCTEERDFFWPRPTLATPVLTLDCAVDKNGNIENEKTDHVFAKDVTRRKPKQKTKQPKDKQTEKHTEQKEQTTRKRKNQKRKRGRRYPLLSWTVSRLRHGLSSFAAVLRVSSCASAMSRYESLRRLAAQ